MFGYVKVRTGKLSVLVSVQDARSLMLDELFQGNVFVRPTEKRVDGERVYERVDPKTVRAAA